MSLLVSKVPRSLETKTRMFGFELSDLLLIFLYLSVSNMLFGATRFKFLLVWVATSAIASFLYFVKRNRPDGFFQHLGEFYRTPGILSAGAPDLDYQPYFLKNTNNISQ
jgi:hypothetical protein